LEVVWNKTTDAASYWVPADGCWDIIFARRQDDVRVFIAGPMTRAKVVQHAESTELFGIRFKPSVFMPQLPPSMTINRTVDLSTGSGHSSLWLEGVRYEMPTNETAELFIDKLRKNGVLSRDAVVEQILEDQTVDVSSRSIQRHFVRTSGLTRQFIEQTKRVQFAAQLLESGTPASDVAARAGYADQAHMARSFKRLLGYTPSQLTRA
jgi:hypothetical protein